MEKRVVSSINRWECRNCHEMWWETTPWEEEELLGRVAEAAVQGDAVLAAEFASDSSLTEEELGVVYYAIRCPACNSESTKVVRTCKKFDGIPRKRYHKCHNCGHSFHSVEKSAD